MKKTLKLIGIIAIAAVLGLSMTVCELSVEESDEQPTLITYTANGNSTTYTTAINLTFSAAVTGLIADDITVTNGPGAAVTKGELTGSGATYSLAVTVATAGNVTVSINKDGIQSGPKTVAVYGPIQLTANQWAEGNIPTSGDQQWFSFTATAATQYLHVSFGTLTDLYVNVYNSSGVVQGSETTLSSSSTNKYISRSSLTAGQTYYIMVRPYGSNSGTYRIGFTALETAPILPSNAIPLTENQWADGSLPTSGEQWFSFTAAASTQYIHVYFGTLTDLYVQVYTSSGATSGSETNYSSTTKSSRPSLTAGQTYYIRVRPYSSYSGDYRIAFTASITAPPVQLPPNAIPLTVNQWADGSLPTSNDEQWFSFTATASTQYIPFSSGTLIHVYVQVYDSSGTEVGSQTNLNSTATNTSRSLTTGQTYYIRVRPYSSSNSGTYRIGFNTTPLPPGAGATPIIPLTANQWADGSLPTSNDEQWFSFTATASTQYIHFAPGTLTELTSLYVNVYNSSGQGSSETRLNSSTNYIVRPLTSGQTYYIMVRLDSGYSGTYRIGFTPSTVPPVTNAIPLTVNQWANGSLPTSNDEQWFSFTATASTQYIHFSRGTLINVSVQVYDSSGATVGSQMNLDSYTTRASRTLAEGQTYYIRVRPYAISYSGTYVIGFTSTTELPNW